MRQNKSRQMWSELLTEEFERIKGGVTIVKNKRGTGLDFYIMLF